MRILLGEVPIVGHDGGRDSGVLELLDHLCGPAPGCPYRDDRLEFILVGLARGQSSESGIRTKLRMLHRARQAGPISIVFADNGDPLIDSMAGNFFRAIKTPEN